MFENDLDEFIAVQKKDHFLYCLKKDIKEKLQMITNILIIRNRLAVLTKCINSLQISKTDSMNKS